MQPAHRLKWLADRAAIPITLLVGLYFIAIRPMGADFSSVPGDLGDARLINYILEHFYRWIVGQASSYWNAPFFYPHPYTIALSENMLGSAPIYAALRLLGLDMLSAFQGWFVVGYVANYLCAAWILSRFGFSRPAAGVGAFFFAFGLPALAQENHAQLLYRFAVPPAFYFLWRFSESARPDQLAALFFWTVLQFFLGIYTGFFLFVTLSAMALVLALPHLRGVSLRGVPDAIQNFMLQLRGQLSGRAGLSYAACVALLAIALSFLIWPYYHVSRLYGFVRGWNEISRLLPRPESYLLADNSRLWSFIGAWFPNELMRHEHQMFVGLAVLLLAGIAMASRSAAQAGPPASAQLWTVLILIALTLNVAGWSLYRLAAALPFVNGLRVITRMELIWMWPLGVLVAGGLDAMRARRTPGVVWPAAAIIMSLLLVSESVFYDHAVFQKTAAAARLDNLRARIADTTVSAPILFVARNDAEATWTLELDAMLVAQERGWSTLNGYSGSTIPEYEAARTCRKLPRRLQTYMQTFGIVDETFYPDIMKRVVLVGFDDCDPKWWEAIP